MSQTSIFSLSREFTDALWAEGGFELTEVTAGMAIRSIVENANGSSLSTIATDTLIGWVRIM